MHDLLRYMDKWDWIPQKIRKLRARAGFNQTAFARAMEYKTPSGWQRFESTTEYKGGYIDREVAAKMEKLLAGKGTPPITRDEIWELAGPEFKNAVRQPLISSFDDTEFRPEEADPDWDGNGAGYLDGRIQFEGTIPGSAPEFSSKPGMGLGQSDDRTARLNSGGIASGHPVLNEWFIPPEYVRNALDASPSQIAILGVIGHSMQPLLNPNDRVMVDFSQNSWLGDAVYVFDELDGLMQVKTLRRISVKPPVYEVVSEADPTNPKIRNHDEIRIIGRVVGRFTRM